MFLKKHSCKILFASNIISSNCRSFNHFSKSSIPRLKVVSCNGKKFPQNEKFTSYVLFTTLHRRTFADSQNNVIESKFGSIEIPEVNLPQYVWKNVSKWSKKPMITCGITGRSYTFEQGRQSCASFARALISKLKCKKGDVIGLLLPNMPEYVIAIHGAMEAGMIVTFVNPLYTSSEIKRQFENADVKYAITIPDLLSNLEAAVSDSSHYQGTIVIDKPEKTESKFNVYDFEELISSQTESVPLYTPSSEEIAVLPYSSGYGMTELSPCALLTPLHLGYDKHGSAGVLIRDTKARVVSLKDGSDQSVHESGELWIKGPQVMKGYWKNDKATEEIIDKEGWLRTGDVVYYDEDEFFFVIDRTKELIKVKGNQVRKSSRRENMGLSLYVYV
ncbi:4-coumarate--CoA ligase [Sarracenia purpurea var. burkii]